MGGGEKLFNLRQRLMRAPAGFGCGLLDGRENRFATDSPLERAGFEPKRSKGAARRVGLSRWLVSMAGANDRFLVNLMIFWRGREWLLWVGLSRWLGVEGGRWSRRTVNGFTGGRRT